ncbi:MAG: ArsR family transcriptional regulator [Candidatus Marinimicrobia bacterium]|nr:ArsR family transcriptional regulator [Candidatus Neomarinimicrobiota bacterium]
MLESLITSKTRINLLLKFFLNPSTQGYLRELAAEFGESSNAVRLELNRLTNAKVLQSKPEGRTIQYRANISHPFFEEISSVVRKMVGLDHIIEKVVAELGGLERAFVTGDYASGRDSGLIDLVLVGEIDRGRLEHLTTKTEILIRRKIRTLVVSETEYQKLKPRFTEEPVLLLWESLPVEAPC